ncbi:MAG: cysteine desulfurase-like protein [Myxococcales bacterium]|nr:cysteine desulfurase-like protein [Myxococcales bacterium]
MVQLDLSRVRAAFPALAGETVFLDNAGGSQCLGAVADAVREHLLERNVQLGASYAVSEAASAHVLEGRRAIARLVSAADDRQVVLGSSTTQLLANLALAMSPGLRAGDEIVVTDADHEANIGPFRRLATRGVVIREWRLDRASQTLSVEDLEPLLGPRTRLVCMTHCSNVLGTIHDVREVAQRVHAAGARLLVDGVAYAPHRRLDLPAFEADYYAFSLYKVYGPHLAALVAPVRHLEELANINHEFLADQLPYKLQPGNVCFELVASLPAVEAYLLELGGGVGAGTYAEALERTYAAVAAHEAALAEQLLAFLRSRGDVTLLGESSADASLRVPTISFVPQARDPESVVRAVDASGIGIRHGDFYARRLIDVLGLRARGGVVRVSMVHYNTPAEVEQVVAALEGALAG